MLIYLKFAMFLRTQVEAERVSQAIVEFIAARAAINTLIDSQTQLLASPDLLLNHPELKWEIDAAEELPHLLGVAQSLVQPVEQLLTSGASIWCELWPSCT